MKSSDADLLKLANQRTPETTLARYSFAARFGMTLGPVAVEMLDEKANGSKRLDVVRKLVADSRSQKRAA